MSQKQARVQRQKAEKAAPKDARQPFRLDPSRAAASRINAYIQGTVQQVLSSKEVENILAGYLDGRDLKDSWGIQLRGQQIGEIWLIPRQNEPVLPPHESDGPSAGKAQVDSAKPSKDSA